MKGVSGIFVVAAASLCGRAAQFNRQSRLHTRHSGKQGTAKNAAKRVLGPTHFAINLNVNMIRAFGTAGFCRYCAGLVLLLCSWLCRFPRMQRATTSKMWHKQIYVQLKSHAHFPLAGRGQTGTAKVGFVLDRQGKLVSHWLAESTGNRALDEESLAILERNQSFPMPPSDLKEDQLTLVVPFDYRSRPGFSGQEFGLWDQEQAKLRSKVNSICRGC